MVTIAVSFDGHIATLLCFILISLSLSLHDPPI